MSTEFMFRCIMAAAFSLLFAWLVFSRYDREVGSESTTEEGQKYRPIISGALLPTYLLVLFTLGVILYGIPSTAKMALTMYVEIFLHSCIYYVFLIIALPFFRNHISARACAMLWLLPNYLYLIQHSDMKLSRPFFIIHAPGKLITILIFIWLIGFILVFSGYITSHLLFRRKILKHSVPVTEGEVWKLFQEELEEIRIQNSKLQLVMSDEITAPLTIGLFKGSTKVVLPRKNYSIDELHLIFKHELIHISREDSWSKFFMMFCTAMCWFNPLMWMAMKKSAEDMELSCDETVLLSADEDIRMQYAELILNTAGDDRGFSTCLSASASAMRYRLKAIVKPQKRRAGAWMVGLTFFILCMTCGYVSLAYGEESGAETVFRNHDLTEFEVDNITVTGGSYEADMDNIDVETVTKYIAELPTQEMTGNYSYSDDEKSISIWYDSPHGVVLVDLYTEHIKVIYLSDEKDVWHVYHLPEQTDWEYIDSIVPPLPTAKVELSDGTQYGGHNLEATVTNLVQKEGEKSVILKDRELQPYEGSGIFSSKTYENATVIFSMPLISDVEILVETWDYSSNYTITLDASAERMTFEVADYPAHYQIRASFQGNNGVYDTTFAFHIGDTDSM